MFLRKIQFVFIKLKFKQRGQVFQFLTLVCEFKFFFFKVQKLQLFAFAKSLSNNFRFSLSYYQFNTFQTKMLQFFFPHRRNEMLLTKSIIDVNHSKRKKHKTKTERQTDRKYGISQRVKRIGRKQKLLILSKQKYNNFIKFDLKA